MAGQKGPGGDNYDAIVVGSGLGGLSAGALLARAGQRVLIVERLDGPGGYAHAFHRGAYIFDPAIHVTQQAHDGQILDVLLRALGVRHHVEFIRLEHFYNVAFPEFRFSAPHGKEAFTEAHVREFPHEAAGIRAFVDLCERVTRESQRIPPELSFKELGEAVGQFPTLFRYRTALLQEVLDDHLTDSRLKALISCSWPYLGLPPSRLSFYTWAAMVIATFDGPLYCRGSFQKLADAFVMALEQNGGEIVFNTSVRRILLESGRVAGVELENGRRVGSAQVISNADARQTFEHLIGREHLPAAFVRKLDRMKPSLSACVVYAATSLDLRSFDPAHEMFVHRHWDHGETFRDIQNGRPGGMWVNVPTIVDSSLAPDGEHLVIFTSHAPYDSEIQWDSAKESYQQVMIRYLEELFPGFRDHVTFVETATPRALERYSLNQKGAIYGWENSPSQAGSQRLNHTTPVPGLYLTGHWTQPGTGSLRATYSGLQTAQLVLGFTSTDQFLGAMFARAGGATSGPPVAS